MWKVGSFSYPEFKVSEIAGVAASIVKEPFRGSITTVGLAQHLGMKEKGGGFLSKLSALKVYGFVEGRGTLKATATAEKVAYSHDRDELNRSLGEAFLRVRVFQLMYERFGLQLPPLEKFNIVVSELTGTSRPDIVKKGPSLYKLYQDALAYLPALKEKPALGRPAETAAGPEEEEEPLPGERSFASLTLPNMSLRVSETPANLELLIQALKIRKQELEAEA